VIRTTAVDARETASIATLSVTATLIVIANIVEVAVLGTKNETLTGETIEIGVIDAARLLPEAVVIHLITGDAGVTRGALRGGVAPSEAPVGIMMRALRRLEDSRTELTPLGGEESS